MSTLNQTQNTVLKKHLLSIIVICVMQLFFDTLHAQAITATTTSTQSIYSNDGTLTIVNPSGGTGPYTYTITTGPADPNITYPVNLPPGQSTFVNLPAGTYTIRITDALGNTTTITATVGGNYQFPSETFDTLSIPGIIATTIGGRSPYQYAISSTGANTGFGPYQTSNVFTHICPGAYWVRVRDSCQNIFTNRVTFKYSVLDSMVCINYSKGFFTTAAYGGHAPYTYHFGSSTNTTGIFTGLPPYFNGMLSWTDSCGVSDSTYIGPRQVHFFEICPFDSNIYVSGPEIAGPVLTMTCTDCTPVQTVLSSSLSPSSPSDLVFQHVAQNHNYHIVITTASCGGDTLLYSITPPSVIPFTIGSTALSCRSAQIIGSGTFDSVVLRNSAGVVIARNTTGTFMDIPDGSYSATAYVHTTPSACFIGSSASTIIHIPMFPSACEAMMKDSSCHTKWEFMVFTDPTMHDTYTLAYNGDTLNPITTPGNTDFFYNLNPGTYTLISDSGCSEPVVLDPFPSVTPTVVSYLPCVGLPSIMVTLGSVSGNMCLTNFSFSLFKADTLYNYTGNPDGSYGVTDSGWYQVREYISSTDANGDVFPYDLTCPLDTTPIFVSTSHLPTPSSNSAYICGTNNADTIFYHIYGGFIPYTVEIPGYDTSTLQTNTGIFPAHQAGQYSMIVYDNCGISRSVTFSVIDTCTACPVAAIASTDSVFCTGDTVHLKSTSGNAILYQWFINGTAYSISSDTIFIAGAGHYTVKLRVQSRSGCRDSILMHFDGGVSRTINLGPDSSYCSSVPFSIVLSTGYASSHWSTGQTGAQITVSAAAQYWVYDSSSCGVKRDTININSVSPYVINLGTDTSYCDTFTRVLSTGIASTHWSTGQTGPQITIDSVGLYWAMASNACGTVRDSIDLVINSFAVNLGPDSTFCIGFSTVLSTGVANTLWSTGQTGPQITIDTAGQYWATDSTICGVKSDTVNIFTVNPYSIDLGADTSYCTAFSRVLSTGIASTQWSTGQTGPQITVDSTGLYWAVATNICGTVRDSILISPSRYLIHLDADTSYCDTFSRILYTGLASTQWSTGQTGPQITVDSAGLYWATDSNICGLVVDTINISQHMIAGFALSTSKDTICIDQPDSAIVLATVDSSGPHVSFIWTGGQIDSAVYNSSLTAHTAGSYRVTVQEAECTLSKIAVIMGMACDTDTTCIHKIAIPNIFSPNSDNKNEEFKVLHTCPEDNFSLHIYNRWGQMVYESTDITKGWDGNYKGKQQAEEVYTWFVCIKSKSGGPDNCQTGTVTLVR
jgi:gliding motility-associated-like protein